ncbi:MAG TPA: DUF368 domain-containing protein [Lachnoclostridium phytofermentans]|uniref:DUF368 domain-containing protein n=1 Tax=Lachnoclostridium phytofermentans TaxID=66219 RepID=A0A3D2X8L3_9FIRM|nr:DUF368 domain-containing protein [Lachnoclostridium sp.]HCL03254.1 DUF368 domain-containing protein [Lachnoclostridium phytofermentans]
MRFIKDILCGILIGIANIIPGVSGGTMAVSMGIYDKIIGSITNLFKQFKKSVITLFPYAIGMVAAIIGLSYFIESFFENYPLQTSSLFVGLILGGVPILIKKVKNPSTGGKSASGQFDVLDVVLFLAFFALIILLQVFGSGKEAKITLTVSVFQMLKLFIIGVIASATMVIPGVSGSMILLILGYYNPIIETINSTIKALSPWDFNTILHNVAILAPFGIGVLVGIFAIAKIIEFLLSRYEKRTYYAILGLVVASPFAIYMGIGFGVITVASVIVSALTFAIGFVVAYYLGRE